jgi:ParB family chromosome partitioning protein
VGKDRSSVANSLRLLGLPNEVKQLVVEGDLDMGHARALLGLGSGREMVVLARQVVADKLTVRETEARVKATRGDTGGSSKKNAAAAKSSPEARKLIEDLQRRLGTKVRLVEKSGGKGTLEVDFFSYEDLDRIVALIRR